MKISGPLPGSGPVRQYQAVAGAARYMPRYADWIAKTKSGDARDPLLLRIDECIKLDGDPKGDGWERLALLGELYFCTNYYLKRAPGVAPRPARESAINDLFLTVVDQLCQTFNCTANFLPQMLEECWGRVLTEHGNNVDTQAIPTGGIPTVARYLDRAAAECYRISFRGGLAYVRDRPRFHTW